VRLVLAVALLSGLFAQAPARQPGPEQARLESLAGRWTIEGEAGGERFTRTETCDWFTGGFHLICRSEVTGAADGVKGQSIIGYDSDEKAYTFYFISSTGTAVTMRGSVSGTVWTWIGDLHVRGGLMKARTTITDRSPTSYTFTMEGSFEGGPWIILEAGRGTKSP
jgi:Protein of unknown function (DUF1579)